MLENVFFIFCLFKEIITPCSSLSPTQVVRYDYVSWRLVLNKRREQRQNDMEIRVERLYKMMQME